MVASVGKDTDVYADGWNLSNVLGSFSPSLDIDALDITVFNSSGVRRYCPGLETATVSGEGLFEGTTGTAQYMLEQALGSSYVVWSSYPAGDTTGNIGIGTKTVQTKYGIDSPVAEVVSVTVDGQSAAGPDRLVSIKSLASVSGTSMAAVSYDQTAATTRGAVGYFQRTDNSTKTVTPIIQHSNNNSTWNTLVSFTAGTIKVGQRVASTGNTVKRYTRAYATIGGSTAVTVSLQYGISIK